MIYPVPVRPLTPRQLSIALLVGLGFSYESIAQTLGLSARYVRNVVHDTAALLPNDDGITPYRLVAKYATGLSR